jgi:hypothetical protein
VWHKAARFVREIAPLRSLRVPRGTFVEMVPGEHAFGDVDAQADPATWVQVLDKLGEEPLYAGYKRPILELLDPQPGGR